MDITLTMIIKFVTIGLSFGIGIYLAKYIKKFLIWIKGGIENGDGKLENKELQIMIFSLLGVFMIISIALWGTAYPDMAFIGVFGGAGVLYSAKQWSDTKKSDAKPPKEENKEDEGKF